MIAPALDAPLVLASGSPRRRQLLLSVGLTFAVRPADVDEAPLAGERPADYVARVAADKARAVAGPGEIVIAADTTVDADGSILAKPRDADDARAMLQCLSGSSHRVHTGVAILGPRTREHLLVTTTVTFVSVDRATIDRYVATGEPHDKAGAYAIQGAGAAFVERVDGSVTNVVGLPLAETLAALARTR